MLYIDKIKVDKCPLCQNDPYVGYIGLDIGIYCFICRLSLDFQLPTYLNKNLDKYIAKKFSKLANQWNSLGKII